MGVLLVSTQAISGGRRVLKIVILMKKVVGLRLGIISVDWSRKMMIRVS